MKNLFKLVVLVTFVFTLSACGRMGELSLTKNNQVDSGVSTSSSY
jgi:predicted small lipoprotein YifL